MAAAGKTPILLYGSTTATNVPSAGNLTNSSDGCEIAINVADKNLFFKDSTNAVNTVPIRQSSASSNGWLSSTDWSTFNSKQPAGSYALTTGTLAQFASTTSAQLAGVISDETGSGKLVFATNATMTSPFFESGCFAGAAASGALYLRNLSSRNRIDSYNWPISATYPMTINASDIQFQIADSTKMTLNSSGNLAFASGNGIDFSATAGTGTSELLADYEEGTWTPIFGGSTSQSGQTYDIQTGNYVKIGKYVFASFDIRLTALGTITGNVQIKGLPYTSISGFATGGSTIQYWGSLNTSYYTLFIGTNSSSTVVDLWGQTGAGTSTSGTLAQANLTNTSRVVGSIMYVSST